MLVVRQSVDADHDVNKCRNYKDCNTVSPESAFVEMRVMSLFARLRVARYGIAVNELDEIDVIELLSIILEENVN